MGCRPQKIKKVCIELAAATGILDAEIKWTLFLVSGGGKLNITS